MLRLSLCGLVVVALLVGCSGTQVTVYPLLDVDERSPTAYVDVFPHPDSLRRAHREIAIINATSNERVYRLDDGHPQLIEALVQKAQDIGADAIVIFQRRDPTLIVGGDRPKSFERLAKAY